MSYRNRLAALETAVRKRPVKCSTCGRGHQHDPEVVVLRQGEDVSRCSACGGCLSPAGEAVGHVVGGKPEVTIICLQPGSGEIVQPPVPARGGGVTLPRDAGRPGQSLEERAQRAQVRRRLTGAFFPGVCGCCKGPAPPPRDLGFC